METFNFMKSVDGDLLPYRFNVDKSAHEVQLVFCNAMLDNRARARLHSIAQSVLEHSDRTIREQLSVFPNVDELSVVKSKNDSDRTTKSEPSEPARCNNFLES